MIIEINKNNLDILDNSFIDKEYITKELTTNPYSKVLILQKNNNLIGYIYYSEIYDRVEINQFEIEKNNRNCGNGKLLLERMISIVQKDITLEVRKDNYPAIKLYEKNGFKTVALRKGYYNGIDGLLMERKNKK